MTYINIKGLSERFLNATVNKMGTDEDEVFDVLKAVAENGVNGEFTSIVGDVNAILESELSGTALKRAAAIFEHGLLTCDRSFGEGFLEVFDLSSNAKKAGFAGGVFIFGAVFFISVPVGFAVTATAASALIAAGIMNAVSDNNDCVAIDPAETTNERADNPFRKRLSREMFGKSMSKAKAREKLMEFRKEFDAAIQQFRGVEQIEYKGIRFTLDDCYDQTLGGGLPEDVVDLMLYLDALSVCEGEQGNYALKNYYEGRRDEFAEGADGAAEYERAARYDLLGDAANDAMTQMERYKTSTDYQPENSAEKMRTTSKMIVAGAVAGLFDETAANITHVVDSIIPLLQPGFIDEDNIYGEFLIAQGQGENYGIADMFREAQEKDNETLMKQYDDLYKHLMREKYRIFCGDGRRIIRDCERMETTIFPVFELDCYYLDKDCRL